MLGRALQAQLSESVYDSAPVSIETMQLINPGLEITTTGEAIQLGQTYTSKSSSVEKRLRSLHKLNTVSLCSTL